MFRIEKGIAIPKKSRNRKYPWEQMEVGDSFVVPREMKRAARSSGKKWSDRHRGGEVKFTDRDDTISKGSEIILLTRIWRIK